MPTRKTTASDLVENANPPFHWAGRAPKYFAELSEYHGCDCGGRGTLINAKGQPTLCECRRHGPNPTIKRELHRAAKRRANRVPERIPTMGEIWDAITSTGRARG